MQCFRCGVCCIKYQARVSLEEGERIAAGLGLSWDDFREKYTDPRWPGTASFIFRHSGGACVFLKRESNLPSAYCLIHSFKPSACSDWRESPGQMECREGLSKLWGLEVDPSGEFTGPPGKLRAFKAFIESLED